MSPTSDSWPVLVGLAMVLGLVGVVVPVLPGLTLVLAAQLLWAVVDGHWLDWAAFAVSAVVIVAAWVLKYLVPARRLQAAGIPWWVLSVAGLAGVVGFFVIPVVGLPLAFVATVYLLETARRRHGTRSLRSTWEAILASGLSVLIELTAGMVAVAQWLGLVTLSRV